MAMMESLQKSPDFQERIIDRTFEENPDIKDLADFQDALFSAFDTERGKRASKWFNGEEVAFLFETSECKNKIRRNISDTEYDRIYGELRRGEYDIERQTQKGREIKPKQVSVAYTPKNVISHTRTGTTYNKGYAKWKPSEVKFLKIRKAKKQPMRKIISEYNQHFKENQRSSSSIKTKIYKN